MPFDPEDRTRRRLGGENAGGPRGPRIHQRPWEIEQVVDLYRQRGPGRILEVGSDEGGTMWHWLQYGIQGARVVSVDRYDDPAKDNRRLYPGWAVEAVFPHAIAGDSHHPQVVEQVRERGPFEWIVLDADPTTVEQDWDLYRPMADPSGCVIDVNHILNPAVAPVWRDIQARGYVTQEIIAEPDALIGGHGLVYL